MYEVRRLSADDLISGLISHLIPFVPKEHRHYLYEAIHQPNETIVVIAAFINQSVVGVTLATLLPITKVASIHSLYVDKNSRQKGIAKDLLEELEFYLKEEKCYLALFLYQAQTPTTPYFEKILAKQGWHTPAACYMKRYFFSCQLFNAPWFIRHYPKFDSLEIFFWKELSDKERLLLERREEQQAFPGYISPFLHEERIEPLNSLGLRVADEIVAWMITHRTDEYTIQYASLYSASDVQAQGYAIYLLQQSIRLQQESSIPWSFFDLNLEQTDKSWQRFIENRLKPWAQVSEIKRAWKELA